MTKRPLLLALLTAAVTVTAMNLLIGAWSHRLIYRKKLEEIRTASNPNLVFIGNSLLDALRVDPNALADAERKRGVEVNALNAALGGSSATEHRLLYTYAMKLHPGIRTLIVGFYDFQLTSPEHYRPMDLNGNRMVGIDRRFSLGEVSAVYHFGRLDRLELEALRMCPMAANRANAWKYVELLRRSMGSVGMPHAATNSMGRVDDFAALEAASPDDFNAQAEAFLQHPDHLNENYEYIFNNAERMGINAVMVVMPMSPFHQTTFYARPVWSQYLAAVVALAHQRGIRVIDASNWLLSEDDFADHLHMSRQGVHEFSIRLGDELTKLR